MENKDEQYQKAIEDVKSTINYVIDKTLNRFGQEILILRNFDAFLGLYFNLSRPDSHLSAMTNGRISRKEEIPSDSGFFSHVMARQMMPYLLSNLREEYHGFINDITCGNYEGALRTLRWLLETTVYYVEFQTDKPNATAYVMLLDQKCENIDKAYQQENLSTFREFQERLFVMEKHRFPGFTNVLKSMILLRNNSNWSKEDTSLNRAELRDNISKLYSNLSKFAHHTIESTIQNPRNQSYWDKTEYSRFDETMFKHVYAIAIEVTDAIFLLCALLDSWFYGYKSFHEYVKAMEQDYGILLRYIEQNDKLVKICPYLPHTKRSILEALASQKEK